MPKKKGGKKSSKVAPPASLKNKGRSKQKMHRMRNRDQQEYDRILEAGLESQSKPKNRPGLGYKKNMSMKQEALNTAKGSGAGIRYGIQYRKWPVEFIKSKEVYDPSRLVHGFKELQLESEVQPADTATEVEIGTEHDAEDELDTSEPSFFIDVDGDDSLMDEDIKPPTIDVDDEPLMDEFTSRKQPRIVFRDGVIVRDETDEEIAPRAVRVIDDPVSVKAEASASASGDDTRGDTTTGIADDELSQDQEQEQQQDQDYDSGLDISEDDLERMKGLVTREIGFGEEKHELNPLDQVLNARQGDDGVEYLVQWAHGDTSYIGADALWESFVNKGFTDQEANEILDQFGGLSSEEEDEEEEGFDFDYYGYQDDYEPDEGADDQELDAIISQLISTDSSSKRGRQRQADIMDSFASGQALPPRKWRGKGKNKVPDFQVEDEELQSYLAEQWSRSRASKAEKRRQRELDRREGRLSKHYKTSGEVLLEDIYTTAMTFQQVIESVYLFMDNEEQSTLCFPPMEGNERSVLKTIGSQFSMTTKALTNKRGYKFIAFIKTKSSHTHPDESSLENIKQTMSWFPRCDFKKKMPFGKMKGLNFRDAARAKGSVRSKHREGDIVGHTAREIESDNIGRQLLEKMGWTSGTGLGVTKEGIVEPLTAKVKMSKKGLGNEF